MRFTYPVIGSCNRLGFSRYLNTPCERLGTCHPAAGLILSRPCAAMGYGPNCKRCSSGLQWNPRLILPCVHSLLMPNARLVHGVLHRNIPGQTRVFHRPVPDICTGNPQASPPSHPPVFHNFSTGCRPTRPQANSRLASCRLADSRTDQVLSSGAGKQGGRDQHPQSQFTTRRP